MLDDLFWMTLLLIFLAPLFGAFFASIRKDRCLKSMDGYHMTYLDGAGRPCWGDLELSSHGFEIVFDETVVNGRGLEKASMLVPIGEGLSSIGFFRTPHVLNPEEKSLRDLQIRRTFQPGFWRRFTRRCRNVGNIIRDALVKSLTLAVGAVGSRHRVAEAITKQKGEVTDLGNTLASVFSNAYEPLLERHIGQRVVVEMQGIGDGASQPLEYPGYLMDYTKDFIAIFQTHDQIMETIELHLERERIFEGGKCVLQKGEWTVSCLGTEALVVHRWEREGEARELGVLLLPGTSLQLSSKIQGGTLYLDRVRNFDMVCPRSRAQVRYGGRPADEKTIKRLGVGPSF